MAGQDFGDNSAIDLGRMRKLAGLPEIGSYGDADGGALNEPTDFEPMDTPADDMGLDTEHPLDAGMDVDMDDGAVDDHFGAAMSPDDVAVPDTALLPAPDTQSHWADTLAQLEQQLHDIPVGDFKEVIDSLHRVANFADDIRRSLMTENKRTFQDYIREADMNTITPVGSSSAPGSAGTMTTIGQNQNDAVTALNARLGGQPTTLNKARKMFDNMKAKGTIKQQGQNFSMQTLDDDDFNALANDPSNQ